MVQSIKYRESKPEPSKVWGIFSLILGILSIIPLFLAPYFGIWFAIGAVICSLLQTFWKKHTTGVGTAGLILGILGIVINIVMGLLMWLYISIFGW